MINATSGTCLKTIENKNGRFVSDNKKNQYERGFTSGRKPGACPENLKWWSWTYHWSRDENFQVQCVEGKILAQRLTQSLILFIVLAAFRHLIC